MFGSPLDKDRCLSPVQLNGTVVMVEDIGDPISYYWESSQGTLL